LIPKRPSPDLLAVATRILADEASLQYPQNLPAVFHVTEKLRYSITRLTGTAGFHSLLSRSLALTKTIVPEIQGVQIQLDGSLQGLKDLGDHDKGNAVGVVLISQFLALLAEFIGEALVMQLVLDTWPDLSRQQTALPEQQ
jgi:hypothetical protein